MKTAIGIGWSGSAGGSWDEIVEYVRFAESIGVDECWSPEAWAQDSVTPLAYLAAITSRIRLGASVMQISARVPAMTAMTAMTLADISGDRFVLGLGVSGPQVVEGLHGASFDRPITRLREHMEIVRLAFAGQPLEYHGRCYELPRPGGVGKVLSITQPANPSLPIYLGTLGPAGLRLTGQAADGWIGTSFMPESAAVFFDPIREAAEAAGRSLGDIDLHVRGSVAFGDKADLIDGARRRTAFILGAMGPAGRNFYNLAYQAAGFPEAAEVQRLWVEGDRQQAMDAIPAELIERSSFFGSDADVLERVRSHARAGVTTIRFDCQGETLADRMATLERVVALVAQVNREEGS